MFRIDEILKPSSLSEALNMLSNDKKTKIIAGGTDLLIKMRHNNLIISRLLSLQNIEELKSIGWEDGKFFIGSSVTFSNLAENEDVKEGFLILKQAALSMGGPQVRNAATIGGNICNGTTSADSAPALFALDAQLLLKSKDNFRIVNIMDFYKGPGLVDISDTEILTKFILNPPKGKWGGWYEKFSTRKAMDISMLGCAVVLSVSENTITDARIALGVAAPTPIRCKQAEDIATGKGLSEDKLNKISHAALLQSAPRTSWRASKEFRSDIIIELVKRCVENAYKKAGGVYDQA